MYDISWVLFQVVLLTGLFRQRPKLAGPLSFDPSSVCGTLTGNLILVNSNGMEQLLHVGVVF